MQGVRRTSRTPSWIRGSSGHELEEDRDDERDDDEVRRQQSCKKAQIAQRLAKLGKRDLKEGREQHEGECGIDHGFERPGAGDRERHQRADSDRPEVHSDLLLFERVSNAPQSSQPFAASRGGARGQATK